MGAPITYTYYPLNTAFGASNYGGTSTTAPTNTNTTWGWNMGQLSASSACQMDFGVEVARTLLTQWRPFVTASAPDNSIGNCWVIGPFHGTFGSQPFVSQRLTISMSFKATTNSSNQAGRVIYRFWKANNLSGSGAVLITGSYISSSISTTLTTTPQVLTMSTSLPEFICNNEYIFIHTNWLITTLGTNNGCDADFVLGVSASNITLPTFISHDPTNLNLIQDEYPF